MAPSQFVRTIGLLGLALGACVSTPSANAHEADEALTLDGLAPARTQTIGFYWVDRRDAAPGAAPTSTPILHRVSGELIPHPLIVTSNSTPSTPGGRLFPWTVTLQPSTKLGLVVDMLPSDWIPQDPAARALATSVGRIEIAADTLTGPVSMQLVTQTGPTGPTAVYDDTFVAFDNDGVGLTAAAPTAWYAPSAQVQDVPSLGITIEWGDYPVEGVSAPVRGVVCHPIGTRRTTPMRTIILNHGGVYPLPTGTPSAPLCAAGTPFAGTLPRNGIMAGDLAACVSLAATGHWRVAMSAYRNLAVLTTDPCGTQRADLAPLAALPGFEQDVTVATTLPTVYSEFCLGEVQDALRWTDIIRLRADDVDPANLLMIGGSQGGCVTLRAVEQGAPVRAAVALAPLTDFRLAYDSFLTSLPTLSPADQAAALADQESFYGTLAVDHNPPQGALEARSPVRMAYPDITRRRDVRLLVGAVVLDGVVHPEHSCRLASVLQQHGPVGISSHFITTDPTNNGFVGGPPPATLAPACVALPAPLPAITWAGPGDPTDTGWPEQRYFLLYGTGFVPSPHDINLYNPMDMGTMLADGPISRFIASIFGP